MNRREFLKNAALFSIWAVIPKKMGEPMCAAPDEQVCETEPMDENKEVLHAEAWYKEELPEQAKHVPSPNTRRPTSKWCSLSYFAVECVPDEFTLCRHCQNL